MAGGFGTRLRPLTNNIPKPMTPIANKPILEHIFNLLKSNGFHDYVMLLYFMPEVIRGYFGNGEKFGVNIQYILPDADYGTAGAVKLAEKFIKGDFIVISGDVLTDFNLREVFDFHKSKNTIATLSLYSAENPLQFGIVLTDENNRIVRFLEKPSSSEVFSDTINTGIYFFRKEIFNHIPEGENYDFSKDLFPKLLGNNTKLFGYKTSGYWRDVGNLEEYITSNLDVLQGKLSYINTSGTNQNYISESATVDKSAIIENSIIGDNCIIENDAVIKNSILWEGVKIEPGVSALFDVIGRNCTIGRNTRINDYVFIGDDCQIGKNVFISSSIKIWNKKNIDSNTKVTKSLIYEDTFFNELFTDSRITGLSNLQINPEFGAKLGTVYGATLGVGKKVLLARDIDDVSNLIKRSISAGMLSSGIEVNDLQVISVPILRQELKNGNGAGGIFVRKSPFDKASTDIIFLDKSGKDLSGNRTKAIERMFFSEEYQRADFYNVGMLKFPERTNQRYREHFLECLDVDAIKKKKFRLVIDYSYGIASTIFPNIIGDLGCEVVSLSAHLDKEKITRTIDEFNLAFTNFTYVIKSLNYDLGFMIDAGSEKIWLVTSDGEKLNGDRFLVLVLKMFLMATSGVKKIAVPVPATSEVDIVAKEYNVEVIRVKDTHFAMMNACDDPEVKFVGGTKGGFLFPEFLYATDGMFSVVKILELIAKTNSDLNALNSGIEKLHMLKENIICPKELKGKVMRMFMEENIHERQYLIDGVRLLLDDDTTVLFIPDRDRNLLHLNVESRSLELSKELMAQYKSQVQRYLSSLNY